MDSRTNFPITAQDIILQCIPQRQPIVMVDTLFAHNEESVSSGFTIRDTDLFVSKNKLQESGLIEHMAQSVALHTGFSYYTQQRQAPVGYIGSINNLKIYQLPNSGKQIRTTVNIIQEFSGITLVEIKSFVDDLLIAEGQMKTVIAN